MQDKKSFHIQLDSRLPGWPTIWFDLLNIRDKGMVSAISVRYGEKYWISNGRK